MPVVSIRVSDAEYAALARRAQIAGQSVSALVRAQIHSASLVDAISDHITRTHNSLAARIDQATKPEPEATLTPAEFRQAMTLVAGLFFYVFTEQDKKQLVRTAVERIRTGGAQK